jgi:hypothetical protein
MHRPEHIASVYQLLWGGLRDAGWMRENWSRNRLAILPDITHYEIVAAPALVPTVLPFLNGESGAHSGPTRFRRAGDRTVGERPTLQNGLTTGEV